MAIFTMPVFCLLVIITACMVWLLASAVYKPLGYLANEIVKKAKDNMSDENTKKTKEIHL